MILAFSDAIADDTKAAGWRRAFAEQSQTTFADAFADEIVLDASTLVKPVQGKERVAGLIAGASSIYESLEFTAEAHGRSTTYLQWRATAFGGMEINGDHRARTRRPRQGRRRRHPPPATRCRTAVLGRNIAIDSPA